MRTPGFTARRASAGPTSGVEAPGTTRKQVGKLFEEMERGALLPLPDERFPFFHEGERIVQRDGHVEVDKSYYSVPPEYLGRRVWVRCQVVRTLVWS